MAFAIKAEVRNPRAKTFAFVAQKTMYGGKRIAKGDTIYFNTGIHATAQFCALVVATNEVKQLTSFKASTSVARESESGRYIITYADPKTPPAQYTVASLGDVGDKSKWTQLTDPNAQMRREIALGDAEEITWKSTDGRMVGAGKPGPMYARMYQLFQDYKARVRAKAHA